MIDAAEVLSSLEAARERKKRRPRWGSYRRRKPGEIMGLNRSGNVVERDGLEKDRQTAFVAGSAQSLRPSISGYQADLALVAEQVGRR